MNAKGSLKGIKDSDALTYLLKKSGYDDVSKNINKKVAGDNIKLINLASNWLHAYLPHVLTKINRVRFGLLSPEYIKKKKNVGP